MPDTPATTTTPDRRQRFRAFMKRFNPNAPAKAIGEGLIYDQPGRSVSRKLAAGADLAPGSQQLVVGGIGSGKTTELMLAWQQLSRNEGARPLYIDVSSETDLSSLNSGALLASLGLRLRELIQREFSADAGALATVFEEVGKAAYGHAVQFWQPEYNEPDWGPDDDIPDAPEPGHYVSFDVPGKLNPPFPPLKLDIRNLAANLSKLVTFLRDKGLELTAVFDGLDRLIRAEQFWAVAEQDLRAIRNLGVSVLVAGPLSVMYGQGRQVKDYFDQVHYLPPALADPKESPFLFEILRLRGAQELMDETEMGRACLTSGGVLRDLISLARSAAENAYLDDADVIRPEHLSRAIEQLGNGYLLGLGTRQVAMLHTLVSEASFSPADLESMELLITRRVLERSETRYEVHPALASVLPPAEGNAQ